MRRIWILTVLLVSLICLAAEGVAVRSALATAEFKGEGQSYGMAELPAKGDIDLNAQDIVLHSDFESYVNDDGGLPLYAADFYELNTALIKYIDENFSHEQIEASAAYIYTAKSLGFDHLLSLNDDDKNEVLKELKAKGYKIDDIAFDKFSDLQDVYKQKRSVLRDAKTEMVDDLYNKLDVIGFIKLDQEARECDLPKAADNVRCNEVKKKLLEVLDKKEFQEACHRDATTFMSAHFDSKAIDYARNYHDVIDMQTIKFIIDDGDYDRQKLRDYMDGALMELYKRGFHPKDEKNMKIARGLHPLIMRRCVALLKNYK